MDPFIVSSYLITFCIENNFNGSFQIPLKKINKIKKNIRDVNQFALWQKIPLYDLRVGHLYWNVWYFLICHSIRLLPPSLNIFVLVVKPIQNNIFDSLTWLLNINTFFFSLLYTSIFIIYDDVHFICDMSLQFLISYILNSSHS